MMTEREKKPRAKAKPKARRKPPTGAVNPENPTLYRPEYAKLAGAMCKYGATDQDLAYEFGVNRTTIRRWQIRHPEFAEAMKLGKTEANARVERSLFMRATGYDVEVERHVSSPDGPIKVRELQHVPPETSAACKWLHNRDPERWKPDAAKVEVTGELQIPSDELSLFEQARRVAFLLGKGQKAAESLRANGGLLDLEVVATTQTEPEVSVKARAEERVARMRRALTGGGTNESG